MVHDVTPLPVYRVLSSDPTEIIASCWSFVYPNDDYVDLPLVKTVVGDSDVPLRLGVYFHVGVSRVNNVRLLWDSSLQVNQVWV